MFFTQIVYLGWVILIHMAHDRVKLVAIHLSSVIKVLKAVN